MPRTPQCTNGSFAQSGAPAFISLWDYVSTLAWWQQIANLITVVMARLPIAPVQTNIFCQTEPLGDLPTTADYLKLIFPPLALATGTYERFGNQVLADAFATYCQCNAGSGTGCEAIWQTMTPATNHGLNDAGSAIVFQPQSAADCYGGKVNLSPIGTVLYEMRLWDPSTTTIMAFKQFTGVVGVQDVFFTTAVALTALQNYTLQFIRLTNDENYLDVGLNATNVHTDALVHYGTYLQATSTVGYPSATRTFQAPMQPWVCTAGSTPPVAFNPTPPIAPSPPTGYPTGPTPPTCGSYQDICDFLQKIDNEIKGLAFILAELQAPIGAVQLAESTIHGSLTGTGTLAVSGILGVKVEFSAPTSFGISPGSPTETWSAAKVSASSGEGEQINQWIGASPHLLRVPYDTTTIGYYFAPGVTGTITELTQGP